MQTSLKRRQGVKPSVQEQLNKVSVKVIEKPDDIRIKLHNALRKCDMLRTLPEGCLVTMVDSMEFEESVKQAQVTVSYQFYIR